MDHEPSERWRAEVLNRAGVTDAQYSAFLGWASRSWSDAQVERFNQAVRRDPESAHSAVREAMSQMSQAGGTADMGSSMPFASLADADAAVRDPRFMPKIAGVDNPKHDPAYRAGVVSRLRDSGMGQTATPAAGSATGAQKFASQAEMNSAFGDKRFSPTLANRMPNPNHDPAFHADAVARARASGFGQSAEQGNTTP